MTLVKRYSNLKSKEKFSNIPCWNKQSKKKRLGRTTQSFKELKFRVLPDHVENRGKDKRIGSP